MIIIFFFFFPLWTIVFSRWRYTSVRGCSKRKSFLSITPWMFLFTLTLPHPSGATLTSSCTDCWHLRSVCAFNTTRVYIAWKLPLSKNFWQFLLCVFSFRLWSQVSSVHGRSPQTGFALQREEDGIQKSTRVELWALLWSFCQGWWLEVDFCEDWAFTKTMRLRFSRGT